jgi:hypothetical protein
MPLEPAASETLGVSITAVEPAALFEAGFTILPDGRGPLRLGGQAQDKCVRDAEVVIAI